MERGSKPLTDLAADWRTLLFPQASDEQFADGYAQAVTFGLLMAKSLDLSLTGGLDEVARKLGRTNTLIGTALRLITEQAEDQAVLVTSLATIVRVLDKVNWRQVARGTKRLIYELFSSLDTDYGADRLYYTPTPLCRRWYG